MREKKLWLVITFHTTAAAIAMEKLCRAKDLPGRLIPVPRELTADCGMSWRAEVQDRAALDFLQETGVEAIHAHEMALLRRFVAGVKKIPGVALYGDFDHERTAVAALNIGDMDSGEVSDILSEDYGIATRPGAHCAPRLHKALGTEEQGAVRFSFGWYNTEEEADAAIAALREIAT